MATVTVSASTTLALLTYAADDDIVGTGAATLTCDSNPNALPAIRSIRSSSPRFTFKVRNPNTAFSAGNLWKLSFTNPGSAIGSGQATLGFTSGATMDFEGEWLICYTATGVAGETVLNAANVLGVDIGDVSEIPYFIEAETAPGSNVWKAVPVGVIGTPGNGTLTTVAQSAFGTGDVGRCLFYDHATRLLKTGDGVNGSLFAAGTRFRITNLIVFMPGFTMVVGAGGWSTGTGSQPVVSSTNAPIMGASASNVNWVIGSECVNISATPTGTSVTVSNRALDGTTAVAHPAGTVLYAIPWSSSTMAGRIGGTNGIFKSRCCTFGRWLYPFTTGMAAWSQIDTAITTEANYNQPMMNGVIGPTVFTRGVIYGNHSRGLQSALRASGQIGSIDIDGPLCVTSSSAASTTSHNNGTNPPTLWNGVYSITRVQGLRLWRIGFASGMTSYPNLFNYSGAPPATGEIVDLETVGGTVSFQVSDVKIRGWRTSYTTGFATTAAPVTYVSFGGGAGAAASNIILHDFDLMSGGVAPYVNWFDVTQFANNVLIHNKIAGTPRTINLQGRSFGILRDIGGYGSTFASMYFTNTRGSGQGTLSGIHKDVVMRNVRVDQLNGVIIPQPGNVYDFPPSPFSANGVSQFTDGGTFYAAPNTYPSLVGGIYLGPVSREQSLDQYELTAGAYTNNSGDFFIETTGDVVLFKSPRRITGVSSVTGGAVVYTSHSSITTGVTAEFRLCKWGDDITAVSWASFTGGNVQTAFNALSGYTSSIGLDFQLRFTATSTVAGRFIRQCYVPVQMDTAYNPPVGSVDINVVGAAVGALAVLYDGSAVLTDTATIDANGEATLQGPYDFDDVEVTGTLKIRELEHESIDTPISWTGESTVPAAMAALTGYVAGPYAGASFNKGTKVVTVSSAMTTQDLWSAWREYIVQLANFDVDDEWTYPELNAGTWEVAFSGAGSITGSYTDVNGTRAPVTAPNLPTGARVQFYDDTNNVELTNEVLASPGASTSLYFTTPVTIRLRAAKLGSLPIEAFGVMTASGLTFIDEFVDDDVYLAKGIDGSTVTEFTADEPNVQIDSDDPDGVSSVWRCYAWFRYYETLSLGIAGNLFGAANAIDTENLAIDSDKADIQLDNVSAVPLKMNDGYMYRTDGNTIIAPTSGSIQMDPKKAYSATGGGGGGATAEEIWTHPSRTLVPAGGVTHLY